MARPRKLTTDALTDAALSVFWARGYAATSIDDLITVTGSSRHAIYGDFGGKHALYLACFDRYQDSFVTPTFAPVEAETSGLDEIATYFEAEIARAEAVGLPGPGCFVANAASETAPHDADVRAKVEAHNTRIRNGFSEALSRAGSDRPFRVASMLTIFASGLWTASRHHSGPRPLRTAVRTTLSLVEQSLQPTDA